MFFSHTNPFLPGRFCLTISYSIFCCVKTKLILEKESERGAIPNHKRNNLILSISKSCTVSLFFSFFRNLTLMKPLWLISPSISLIGDSSWFLCFTLKLRSISIFFWKPNSTGVSWTAGNQQSKSFPQRINASEQSIPNKEVFELEPLGKVGPAISFYSTCYIYRK